MKKTASTLSALLLFVSIAPQLQPHCEVPCGIYNDQMRFTMIEEHIATIEKAMLQIGELSGQQPANMNQIVRWVVNKEEHAEEIQHIISQYFLTQRLKLADKQDADAVKKLQDKLALCHEIMVYSMNAKQTTDPEVIESLKTSVKNFKEVYFEAN